MEFWIDQYTKARSLLRFLQPFFSLQFWKLNCRTLQIKASQNNWGNRNYAEYLQYYYSKKVNPYYETIADKWNSIRLVMIEMAEMEADDRVLDIGSGLGFQAAAFAAHGYETTGIDLVFDRLKIAGQRHKQTNLNWILADATCLPLAANACDVVAVSLMLHDMPIEPLQKVLSEIHRVARRRVVIAEPRMPKHWLFGPIYKSISSIFDESVHLNGFLETDFEALLKIASLRLIDLRLCAHNTLAIYACDL